MQDESTYRQRGRLAQDNGVWERPQGLMGIWGGMIRGWLDELLPADAADSCRGRVAVSVTAIRPAMPPLRVRSAGPRLDPKRRRPAHISIRRLNALRARSGCRWTTLRARRT
jgi:hypothetical protein